MNTRTSRLRAGASNNEFRVSCAARLALAAFAALLVICPSGPACAAGGLPFSVVFRGQSRFERLVQRAADENWSGLPIGQRTAAVGRALVGTPYQSYTLEIDDRIEAVSANFEGMDCWTFFEISLAFARMIAEPREQWTPQNLLRYIEMDRYRGLGRGQRAARAVDRSYQEPGRGAGAP